MKPILSNMLWIPEDKASTALKNELTVQPRYEEIQPAQTYKEEAGWFGIPRNYYTNIEYEDQRVVGKPINIQFTGTLRQSQKAAIKEWQKLYDQNISDWIFSLQTGGGKTILALYVAAQLGVPFLVIVPREQLMGQWAEKIIEFTNIKNANIGRIQQKKCDYENKPACVGMIHSICKDQYPEEFKNHFGLVVIDEGHIAPAQTFSEVLGMFPAAHRLALSATVDRSDGMIDVLFHHVGKNIITSKKTQPKPTVGIVKYKGQSAKIPSWATKKIQQRAWILSHLATNKERDFLIAKCTDALLNKGLRTLVVSERIHQLTQIEQILRQQFDQDNIGLFISDTKDEKKKALLDNGRCLLCTSRMIDVGIDKDTFRGLVFATPTSDVRQVVGRIRRINDAMPDPIVIDVIDYAYKQTQFWAKKRLKWYEDEGFDVQEVAV